MICIECSNPAIKCLYSDFKSKYIQLTVCQECGKVADKYIEYDKVILFLDVLLLKPQAYRHAAYNLVEDEIFNDIKVSSQTKTVKDSDPADSTPEKPGLSGRPRSSTVFNYLSFARYSKLRRYLILSILFEVYLEWAYEEKSAWNTQMVSQVLRASPLWQYGFFILKQCIGKLTLYLVMVTFFTQVLKWGSVQNPNLPTEWNLSYHRCVLMSTILMSLAVKSLPIIMLIWPYDNAAVANSVVTVLGMFNTIEALKVITHHSYSSICAVVFVSNLTSILAQQVTMCLLVGQLSSQSSSVSLFEDECRMAVVKVVRVFEMAFRE